MNKCTKKNCPMNAENLNPYRTEISGDLISRQEAINELKLAYFNKDLQSAKDDPCIVDAMTDWAIRTIKRLPSVTPKAEWIPVSERLPAFDEDVLVTNGRGMYIGWIDRADMIWRVDSESEYFMYDIVAWMPLPEPYKAESEDNG